MLATFQSIVGTQHIIQVFVTECSLLSIGHNNLQQVKYPYLIIKLAEDFTAIQTRFEFLVCWYFMKYVGPMTLMSVLHLTIYLTIHHSRIKCWFWAFCWRNPCYCCCWCWKSEIHAIRPSHRCKAVFMLTNLTDLPQWFHFWYSSTC